MMKQLIAIVIILLCIAGCKVAATKEQPYSEWSFQCRATGDYFYEDDGTLKAGKQPVDDRYRWVMEATDSAQVRMRNKKTGHYLRITSDGKVVSVADQHAAERAATWNFKGFDFRQMKNCSWYTLTNMEAGNDRILAQEAGGLVLKKSDRNTDFSTHWTVVREAGSLLPFTIYPDSVVDASFLGDRVSKAISDSSIFSDYHGKGHEWKLKKDIAAFPRFTAKDNTMLVALYNMALEEMQLNLRTDSTFMTGALWPDTWTRDVVYSIYFAFSWIHQDIAVRTLRKQTLKNPKEALQDTGTGGSWPISTDRVVWALAAWEYYLATGDKAWLEEAYESLRYTAQKDIHVAFDEKIGLFRGEACSMDWRTHTYPNWFSNENIGESFSSGTNALHLFSYEFLQKASLILGKDQQETALWKQYASRVREGLNTYMWDSKKGLYAAYLYPAFMDYRRSDRVDIMSNGLCALLGVASPEQVRSIVDKYPLYPYGGAVLYPAIPDDFAYHNKSIWVVWQTPLLYTAGAAGNMAVASHLMRSQVRQGAMFLTHKENMTYETGFDQNTALNSDRQLWSVASYISMVYRMLFGMNMTEQGLAFSPTVPPDLVKGEISLQGFKYREAVLDITVTGTGNKIRRLTVNGKQQSLPYTLPSTAKGKSDIRIEMEGDAKDAKMNLVEAGPGKCWSPIEPVLQQADTVIRWEAAPGLTYKMVGPELDETATSPYSLKGKPNGFYSVYAEDGKGFRSDLSAPAIHSSFTARYEAEKVAGNTGEAAAAKGFSGSGYVRDFADRPATVSFEIELPQDGDYLVSLRGSNGHGPHDVYCFIRSVFFDGKDAGTFILESSGNWETWTNSNQLLLKNVTKGRHTVQLKLNPEQKGFDNNMSFSRKYLNDAFIDCLNVVLQ
jgi:hypothetical protein